MRPKVFITDRIPEEALTLLSEHCEPILWQGHGKIPKQELIRHIFDAEGIINDMITIDEEVIGRAPRLRAVSNMSVGYNNLAVEELRRRDIIATNTPGVLNDSVADLAVALMLAAARRIPEMDRYVKSGSWKLDDYKDTFGVDVHHSTVGIIGMGRIGEVVARRLALGFDARILYCNRNRRPELEASLGVIHCRMEELLQASDFVVLLTPLKAETRHLIGERELSLMKPEAILVNVSRGAVIDEKALIHCLRQGGIRAAALDVYEQEPVERDNALLTMPNVVTLPHLGTATEKATFDMAMLAAKSMVEALVTGTSACVVPELRECTGGFKKA